jgi:hypothetical protein
MVNQAKVQNMDQLKESFRDACACVTPDVLKLVRHELRGSYVPVQYVLSVEWCSYRPRSVYTETIFLMYVGF